MNNDIRRNNLTNLVYPGNGSDVMVKLDRAFELSLELYEIRKKSKDWKGDNNDKIIYIGFIELKIKSSQKNDGQKLKEYQKLIADLYEVDAYEIEDYLSGQMKNPTI